MARLGSKQNPCILRVQTVDRAREVTAMAVEAGVQFMLGIEADQDEDISDIERARHPAVPFSRPPAPGRNDPCPCGSGKKFKKCCG